MTDSPAILLAAGGPKTRPRGRVLAPARYRHPGDVIRLIAAALVLAAAAVIAALLPALLKPLTEEAGAGPAGLQGREDLQKELPGKIQLLRRLDRPDRELAHGQQFYERPGPRHSSDPARASSRGSGMRPAPGGQLGRGGGELRPPPAGLPWPALWRPSSAPPPGSPRALSAHRMQEAWMFPAATRGAGEHGYLSASAGGPRLSLAGMRAGGGWRRHAGGLLTDWPEW